MKSWVLVVRDPTGATVKACYSQEPGTKLLALDSVATFSRVATVEHIVSMWGRVTPDGSCLEGEIICGAVGSSLNISPFDIVEIQTAGEVHMGEDPARHYRRYGGTARAPEVTQTGELRVIPLVGHDDELTYATCGQNYDIAAGGDVGLVAHLTLLNAEAHESLRPPQSVGLTGTITTGAVNAQSSNLRDFLGYLVGLCKEDGKDAVFGVDAHRRPFFKLRSRRATGVSESLLIAEGGRVVPRQAPAPEHVSMVRMHIGAGTAKRKLFGGAYKNEAGDNITLLCGDPLASAYGRRYVTRRMDGGRAMMPIAGVSYNTIEGQGFLRATYQGGSEDALPTISRVGDADPSSFIVLRRSSTSQVVRLRATLPAGTLKSDIAQVTLELKTPESSADMTHHRLELSGSPGGGYVSVSTDDDLFKKGNPDFSGAFTFGDRARAYGSETASHVELVMTLFGSGTHEVAVQDFRLWRLDTLAIKAAARGEYQEPQGYAYDVIIPAAELDYSEMDLSTRTAQHPGARVDSSTLQIDAEGISTVVHIGPPEDAGELASATVARRAVQRAITGQL